jgi:VWFA-related protein
MAYEYLHRYTRRLRVTRSRSSETLAWRSLRSWHKVLKAAMVLALGLAAWGGLHGSLPARAQGNVTITVDRVEAGQDGKNHAYVTVRDENGVPIAGLNPDNFDIIEDQSTYFPPEQVGTQVNPAAAMSVALILDLSGTMKGQPLEEAKKASSRLLEALLNEPNDPDRAAFFGINGPVDINNPTVSEGAREAGFTNDRNKILNLINPLEVTGNSPTPLYDALFRVVKIAGQQPGPRAIIVITDGQDKVSSLSADDPISEANRNHIPIFPVGFSRGPVNDDYLTRLAARTGGTYTKAREASSFTQGFQDILSTLSQQYVLTYQTRLESDGQPHVVMVRVRSPQGTEAAEKVFIGAVPTAAPTIPAVVAAGEGEAIATTEPVAAAVETVEPAASAIVSGQAEVTEASAEAPSTPQSFVAQAQDWVKDRSHWPILIAALAGLLLLIALILILVLRRGQPPAGSVEYQASAEFYAPSTPSGPGIEPATVQNRAAPGAGPTTAGAGSYPQTDYAATGEPGWPSQQTAQAWPPAEPSGGSSAEIGKTVLISRAPAQPKVLAILVNRKRPQERFDVLASTDIGRGTVNQIILQSATVSRQHAKIREEGGEFKLYDLASANGTFVNEAKVLNPVVLKDGDIVRFGEAEFLFRILT